jgi:hypothetical protein
MFYVLKASTGYLYQVHVFQIHSFKFIQSHYSLATVHTHTHQSTYFSKSI